MKIVILAGGPQSTVKNEGFGIPKPMADIGGKPLLWHIMKHFSEQGYHEFIVCAGYKIEVIKDYFMDFYAYESDITVDLAQNIVEVHKKKTEDWKVTVVDTGINAATAVRISRIEKYIKEDDFLVTYGDCLSDISIEDLIAKHKENGKVATMTLSKPIGRNQLLPIDAMGNVSYGMNEIDTMNTSWINAGCFLFNRKVFQYIKEGDDIEKRVLSRLSEKNELASYMHNGYWTAIETQRNLVEAEELWNLGRAPWIKEG